MFVLSSDSYKSQSTCDAVEGWDNTQLPRSDHSGNSYFDSNRKIVVFIDFGGQQVGRRNNAASSMNTTSDMLKSIHCAFGLAVIDYARICLLYTSPSPRDA